MSERWTVHPGTLERLAREYADIGRVELADTAVRGRAKGSIDYGVELARFERLAPDLSSLPPSGASRVAGNLTLAFIDAFRRADHASRRLHAARAPRLHAALLATQPTGAVPFFPAVDPDALALTVARCESTADMLARCILVLLEHARGDRYAQPAAERFEGAVLERREKLAELAGIVHNVKLNGRAGGVASAKKSAAEKEAAKVRHREVARKSARKAAAKRRAAKAATVGAIA